MTIGQLCFYDQIKQTLLATGSFEDNLVTHFSASLGAVGLLCCVELNYACSSGRHCHYHDPTVGRPEDSVDECKARYCFNGNLVINPVPGEFAGSMDIVRTTLKEGPMAFYKASLTFSPIVPFRG
jgi:dicarboxylate transporter 10